MTEPVDANLGARAWAGELFIVLAAAVLLFAGLGESGLRHSEGRWAEITREMLLSGDFFHPTIGGQPYFDKPLLSYWLVAGASTVRGRVDEWSARAPSALSGIIVLLATMWIGRRLWSARVGWLAGVVLLTSYGFLSWARDAQADMENLAAITLAVAWYWTRRDRPEFSTFLGFYLIVFLGALTKGLPAVVVPVLAVLPDVVTGRRWRRLLAPSHALAAIAALVVYLAPFWYARYTQPAGYGESGLDMVFRENIQRYFRPWDHMGPIYLYFYYLPYLLLPWSPLLLAAIPGFLKMRRQLDHHTRWLLWSAMVIFAFFTLSGSRRGYYILPLLPFCALMIGVFFLDERASSIEFLRSWGLRIQGALLGVLVVLELGGVLIGRLAGRRFGLELPPEILYSMPVVAVAASILGYAGYRLVSRQAGGSVRALAAMVGVSIGLVGGLVCYQRDELQSSLSGRPFVLRLAERTRGVAPEDIGVFKDRSPILPFYMKAARPLTRLRDVEDLRRFLKGDRPRVVVMRRRFIDAARLARPPLLQDPPDLVQEGAPWADGPSGDDWVAWVNPG